MAAPSVETLLEHERSLWSKGFERVGGIDEAGRGPLAGPVVAACVVFDPEVVIEGVWDSKKISEKKRESFFDIIVEKSLSYGVGILSPEEIDTYNIYKATQRAMLVAVDALKVHPDFLLTDAMPLNTEIPMVSLVSGDQKSFTIAAASILAKVTRDRIMKELHAEFPMYGWDHNKGYPTREHREAVIKYGLSPYHRKSFRVRI